MASPVRAACVPAGAVVAVEPAFVAVAGLFVVVEPVAAAGVALVVPVALAVVGLAELAVAVEPVAAADVALVVPVALAAVGLAVVDVALVAELAAVVPVGRVEHAADLFALVVLAAVEPVVADVVLAEPVELVVVVALVAFPARAIHAADHLQLFVAVVVWYCLYVADPVAVAPARSGLTVSVVAVAAFAACVPGAGYVADHLKPVAFVADHSPFVVEAVAAVVPALFAVVPVVPDFVVRSDSAAELVVAFAARVALVVVLARHYHFVDLAVLH